MPRKAVVATSGKKTERHTRGTTTTPQNILSSTARDLGGNAVTRQVATLQGVYYIVTGIWPIMSMYTFESVSGPKTDDWLVHTVAVLVIVTGLVLLSAAIKRQMGAPVRILGIGTAAGLATIEFIYALQGVIWPIYMLDAIGELMLIVLWVVALVRDRRTVAHA